MESSHPAEMKSQILGIGKGKTWREEDDGEGEGGVGSEIAQKVDL